MWIMGHMRIPSASSGSDKLISLGEYHAAALGETPDETGSLIEAFRPSLDALVAAAAARVSAERAMIGPRVALRFAERRLETEIRRLSFAAQTLDGIGGGPVWSAVFPNGLTGETSPRSAAQVASTETLLQRLSTLSSAEPLRADHTGKIRAGIDDLNAKLAARKSAGDALGLAYAQEVAAREDFVRAYDASAGAIRQIFPRDRAGQNLYFDEVRHTHDVHAVPDGTRRTGRYGRRGRLLSRQCGDPTGRGGDGAGPAFQGKALGRVDAEHRRGGATPPWSVGTSQVPFYRDGSRTRRVFVASARGSTSVETVIAQSTHLFADSKAVSVGRTHAWNPRRP